MMIIDTAHEIKVGVGYDWKPVVLGPDEMQVSEGVMRLMGAEFGDKIEVPLDFSGWFGTQAKAKLFALMLAHHETAFIDMANQALVFNGDRIPLSVFGIEPEDLVVKLMYTLAATYEKPNGKFSLIFSESAIVDCHYIFSSFLESLEVNLEEIKDEHP
eukprot:CAMPEP_0170452344 /NCGR_PEP_ID=MMETSP0123-20130129/1273_1 /TAXON_ID=182087 /ORGANISM="Favella ehrenbergii, Strain Fehren 1" /LENGTH=157 /DNA_ID=CAMNT_0010714317 /DNA_START=760 /DNA_END=1233 /DNA_ORIENTATION=+